MRGEARGARAGRPRVRRARGRAGHLRGVSRGDDPGAGRVARGEGDCVPERRPPDPRGRGGGFPRRRGTRAFGTAPREAGRHRGDSGGQPAPGDVRGVVRSDGAERRGGLLPGEDGGEEARRRGEAAAAAAAALAAAAEKKRARVLGVEAKRRAEAAKTKPSRRQPKADGEGDGEAEGDAAAETAAEAEETREPDEEPENEEASAETKPEEKEEENEPPGEPGVFFGRRLCDETKAERAIVVRNDSLVPARWTLVPPEDSELTASLAVDKNAGLLAPGEETSVSFAFGSAEPEEVSALFSLRVFDEGARSRTRPRRSPRSRWRARPGRSTSRRLPRPRRGVRGGGRARRTRRTRRTKPPRAKVARLPRRRRRGKKNVSISV